MLAGALGVGRDREGRCEVEIALKRQPERAAGAVLEEFLALGGADESHGFDSCVVGPDAVHSPRTRTAPGPPGIEREIIEAG